MPEVLPAPALARRRFAATPEAGEGARRWAATHLTAHRLTTDVKDDVALVLGEFVANVVTHTDVLSFDVSLSVTDDVTVVVTDGAATLPFLRPATADGESGRGIRIVEALCESWGSTTTHRGKSVWAHLSRGA